MLRTSRKPCPASGPAVKSVTLHQVSPTLAFARVVLPGVSIMALRVEVGAGKLFIQAPSIADQNGKQWPIYVLQSGVADAVEAAITLQWLPAQQYAAPLTAHDRNGP